MIKVPLDNPVSKTMLDGTVVLFDHLWLTGIHADAKKTDQPVIIRVTMQKARDTPEGIKELYTGEPPIELMHPDFFAMANENPGWGIVLEQILSLAKIWARSVNAPV